MAALQESAPPPAAPTRRRATLYTLENNLAYDDPLPRNGGAIRADIDGRWIAYDDAQRLGEVLEIHYTEEFTRGGFIDVVHVYYNPNPPARPRLVQDATPGPPEALYCWYRRHRATDWTPRAGGTVACGVCHPPPVHRLEIVRRGEAGFQALEAAAVARMTGQRPRCACGTVLSSDEARKRGTCAECNR